jgi:hypothetical protein
VSPGRHRARRRSHHIAFRSGPRKHFNVTDRDHRLRRGFGVTIGTLVVANSVLGVLVLHRTTEGGTLADSVPLPAISIAPPAPWAPPTRSPRRALPQKAKARPPVELGPANLGDALTGYCTEVKHAGAAVLSGDNWRCGSTGPFPSMDAACRWLYDAGAWAGMKDDTDPQTWRCYHDAS